MVLIFRVGMALALRPQGGCTFVLTLELDGSPAVSPSSRSVGLFQTECRGGRALLGFSLPQMAVSQNLPSQTPVPCSGGEAAKPVELGHRVSPGGPERLVTASVRAQEAWGAAWSGSPIISLHGAFKGKNTPVSSD